MFVLFDKLHNRFPRYSEPVALLLSTTLLKIRAENRRKGEKNRMERFEEITSPEFYDCFSSPKPLITPSKLFLGDCADEKAIDWTILENCNPNLAETPLSVRSTDSKRFRKSLIPVFSPSQADRQPAGVLSASGNRGSKSRRISHDITDALACRVSSGRKSVAENKDAMHRELSQKQAQEIVELRERLTTLEAQSKQQEETIGDLREKLAKQESVNAGLQDELTAVRFFAQVQGQKIEEQENLIMTSKMDYQEDMSAKNRKYKTMIKKLQADRANYESGAATIIQQLNDQMAQLQKFAMTRIEVISFLSFFLSFSMSAIILPFFYEIYSCVYILLFYII